MKQAMDKQFDTNNWLIEHLLGKGLYLLAGAPKIGKSWLILWIAHQVSIGEKVWDFNTRQCDVLYISLEDPERRLQARIAKVSGGETGNILMINDAEVLGNGFEEQIKNQINNQPTIKFVIVDTLQKIRKIFSTQCSYADDYDIGGKLKALADQLDITILVVHHTRKASAADPFSQISGTTGLSGSADGSLVLIKNDRMDHSAKLYATGRDILDMELDLLFDPDTATWQFLGYGRKESFQKRDLLLSTIKQFIEDKGPFHGTASELLTLLSARTELQIKSANALTRLLNPQKSLLQYEYGILYNFERTGKERTLHLTRISNDDSDDILTPGTDTVTIVTE